MDPHETCWTMVRAAAAGDALARSAFSRSYGRLIRSYLGVRWRGSRLTQEVEDACQDVFVECFKQGGALPKVDPARGDFRALLFAVVRNVARRHEERMRRGSRTGSDDEAFLLALPSREQDLARAFDVAWAREMIAEAIRRHAAFAAAADEATRTRLRVLLMRVQDELPVRTIAERAGFVQRLRHAASDPDLASVRDDAALAELPPAEAALWRTLWRAVVETADPLERPR